MQLWCALPLIDTVKALPRSRAGWTITQCGVCQRGSAGDPAKPRWPAEHPV